MNYLIYRLCLIPFFLLSYANPTQSAFWDGLAKLLGVDQQNNAFFTESGSVSTDGVEDETDDAGENSNKIFIPENRPIPKTFTTAIEKLHPKKIDRIDTTLITEFGKFFPFSQQATMM